MKAVSTKPKSKEGKNGIEIFEIPFREPHEYVVPNQSQNHDPLQTSMDSIHAIRNKLTYGYAEYVSHTILHKISTIQWLPELWEEESNSYHQFIMGTNNSVEETDDQRKNMLVVYGFVAPEDEFNGAYDKCRIAKGEMTGFAPYSTPTFLKKIYVQDALRLVRYMPGKWTQIATLQEDLNSKIINIYDLMKHPKIPKNRTGKSKPNIVLSSPHPINSLDWNHMKTGYILAANSDGQICVWDVNGKRPVQDKDGIRPVVTVQAWEKEEAVDARWHYFTPDLVATIPESAKIGFFDIRATDNLQLGCAHRMRAHTNVSNIALSPLNEYLFATSHIDNTIKLWDLRHTRRELFSILMTDPVTQIEFAPHAVHMLAAATRDPSVVLLNLAKVGRYAPSDRRVEDGYAETQFIHYQRQEITDFSWGPPNHPWRMATADGSIGFKLWMPSLKYLYEGP